MNIVSKSFDDSFYSDLGVSADKVSFLEDCAQGVEAGAKITVEGILEIGKALCAARQCFNWDNDFGHWRERRLPWLESRTALNFMQVATKFGAKNFRTKNILPSVLYELSAPSTPDSVVSEVLQRSESGERVRVAEVKKLIKEAKQRSKGSDTNVVNFPVAGGSSVPALSAESQTARASSQAPLFPALSRDWVNHYSHVYQGLRFFYERYVQGSDLSTSAAAFVASMPESALSELTAVYNSADFLVKVIAELNKRGVGRG